MADKNQKLNPIKSFWDGVRHVFYYIVISLIIEIIILSFTPNTHMLTIPDTEIQAYRQLFNDIGYEKIKQRTIESIKTIKKIDKNIKMHFMISQQNPISGTADKILYKLYTGLREKLISQLAYISLRINALIVLSYWGIVIMGLSISLSWKIKTIKSAISVPGQKLKWWEKIHKFLMKKKTHPMFYSYIIIFLYLTLPFSMNSFYLLIGAIAIFGILPYIISGKIF